jgi:D-alanyl-D-alanine carboxypeptidase (penicillin-binding protein 5/6)
VGRLVDSAADVPPPQTPAPRLPDLSEPPPAPIPVVGGGEPLLLPVGLAVVCAGVVVAALVGVRRRSGS